MQKKANFTQYFLLFLLLSLLILALSQTGKLKPLTQILQNLLSPVQAETYKLYSGFTNFTGSTLIRSFQKQNLTLTQKLVDQTKLIQDNKALQDQFQTQEPRSTTLLPADVIGAPGFIPGVSDPQTLTINKGVSDGLKSGLAVIYQNNLIGRIVEASAHLSEVDIITNPLSSFTAKTLTTQSLGVINGQGGGEMILDNVVLSDTLQMYDIVLTKGDIDQNGVGLPPDLVVGKISSISKSPSELFQKAEVRSLIDFTKLNKVFVITSY